MQGFSRSEWAAAVSRVEQAGFRFDPKWKCLVCGKRYLRSACGHDEQDNLDFIEKIRETSS